MTALPSNYQDNRPYCTAWYRLPDGRLQSFRWHADKAQEQHAKLIKAGAVETADPFRKGAPVGGHGTGKVGLYDKR